MGEVLDGAAVRRWCGVAADALGRTRAEIDALNVFPVPDGDTGTNLHLTVRAAADALDAVPPGAGVPDAWRALAQGALLGARGNSGVILSQVFRGLADVLGPLAAPPDGTSLAGALAHASALARGAVEHSVEGTILSVLAAAATAGAAGLCVVLDALAAVVTDECPERYEVPARTRGAPAPAPAAPSGPGYEVMYLLDAPDDAVPVLRERLDALGDSLVVVGGDGLWNVHVHVDDAGAAVEAGLGAGRPHRIRVTYLHAATGGPHAPHTGRAVHDPLRRFGEDVIEMTRAAGATRSGHLEVAAREAVTSVGLCQPGDVLGLIEGDVATIGADVAEVARHVLDRMLSGGGELVTLITGRHAPPGLAAALEEHLRAAHPDVEAGTYDGGQERYPLLIGVE